MLSLPLFLTLAPALALAATCDSSAYLGADHGPVPCRVIPRCGTEGLEPTVEGLSLWNPTQVSSLASTGVCVCVGGGVTHFAFIPVS